jgi:hypothetical protein
LAKTFSQFPMDFGKSRKFLGDDLKLTKKLKSQTEEKGLFVKYCGKKIIF